METIQVEKVKQETKAIVDDLLKQKPTKHEEDCLSGFIKLQNEYLKTLEGSKEELKWEKIEPLQIENSIKSEELPKPNRGELITLLKKLVILKINGGLGTTMGCTGPKSIIEVRNGKTFLDLIVQQIKSIYNEYGVKVPLLLMNSFNTDSDTKQILKKYENDEACVFYTFCQHKFPRIYENTLLPVPKELNGEKSEWYPPGHGDFLQSFVDSDCLEKLKKDGREIIFSSNVDNLGGVPDLSILKYVYDNGLEYVLEETPKTMNDIKGGTLIKYDGKYRMLETAQVPKEHFNEFCDVSKFKVFNCNNIWMRIDSVERVIKNETLLQNMDIIVNRKVDNHGNKVIQLETAIGCAVAAFEKTCAIIVPRNRFLPVKACNDLLRIQSNMYGLTNKGFFVDGAQSLNEYNDPPIINLSKEYQHVGEYLKRMKVIPDLAKIHKLNVEGDIVFGENVHLIGDVELLNQTGKQIEISNVTYENETIKF